LRGRRSPNYQVNVGSLIKGALVGMLVSALASVIVGLVGGGLFIFLIIFMIAPAIAETIVRAVDWATRSKRGRPMQITVAASMIVGGLLAILFVLGTGAFLPVGLFLLVSVSTAVARLR